MSIRLPLPVGCEPDRHQVVRDLLEIFDTSYSSGPARIYLVGGYLRDCLRPKLKARKELDFDFAVAGAEAIPLARLVAEKLSGHFVLLDNKNDTARVVMEDGTCLDFAGCVGGSIESDIKRRDFTINSLVWDPYHRDKILDLVGGVGDLADGVLNAIDGKNLVDDPLRLLRAYRLAAECDCVIGAETVALISEHADKIEHVPYERTNYEFFLMMESDRAGELLSSMAQTGLLEAIFSDLKATRQVTANQFHHLGLFEHSLECVRQTELYIRTCPDWAKESAAQTIAHGVSRLSATKTACLLHDIGKPGTWEVTEEGRHTFLGHDKLGATMTTELAKEHRWSKQLGRFVAGLVKWHLRPGHLFHQGPATEKAINKFYRKIGDDVPELMMLAFGDLGATRGADFTEAMRENLAENFRRLLEGYPAFRERENRMPRLLSGVEVMELLVLQPGPAIGEILEALEEAQSLQEVTDVAEAQAFVREFWRRKNQ